MVDLNEAAAVMHEQVLGAVNRVASEIGVSAADVKLVVRYSSGSMDYSFEAYARCGVRSRKQQWWSVGHGLTIQVALEHCVRRIHLFKNDPDVVFLP